MSEFREQGRDKRYLMACEMQNSIGDMTNWEFAPSPDECIKWIKEATAKHGLALVPVEELERLRTNDLKDAYVGAMQDKRIWKSRALTAESKLRVTPPAHEGEG